MPNPLTSLIVAAVIALIGLWLIHPRGILARWQQGRRKTERTRSEDALKHLFDCETTGQKASVQSIAGVLQASMEDIAELLPRMEQGGLLQIQGQDFQLTARGRASALHIIRAHRLWERYLADETGVAETEWHERAEWREHTLSRDQAEELSARLGHPTHDPHGDPIPTPTGEMASHGGQSLAEMPADASVRIVHLEDEPANLYAQLVALGLHPGMELRLLEKTSERLRFWAGGSEHVLAPIVAANVSVVPLTREVPVTEDAGVRLGDLDPGESGEVVNLSLACRGLERRRMMDLGLLPGTMVSAELRSPSLDPTAYRIRGAVIALRRDQANLVHIKRTGETRI